MRITYIKVREEWKKSEGKRYIPEKEREDVETAAECGIIAGPGE